MSKTPWCMLMLISPITLFFSIFTEDARRARLPAIDYETVENDARALLLTNARHGFHNSARYWRGDGDASNCFS